MQTTGTPAIHGGEDVSSGTIRSAGPIGPTGLFLPICAHELMFIRAHVSMCGR